MMVNTNAEFEKMLKEHIDTLTWGGNGVVTRLENGLEHPSLVQNTELEKFVFEYKVRFGVNSFIEGICEAIRAQSDNAKWVESFAQKLYSI